MTNTNNTDQIITERITALQELQRIARVPGMREIIWQIARETLSPVPATPAVTQAMSSSAPVTSTRTPRAAASTTTATTNTRARRTNGRRNGSIRESALSSIRKFTGPFSAKDLRARMEKTGYRFGKNGDVAVYGIVTRLLQNGDISLHEKRSGRTPARYLQTARSSDNGEYSVQSSGDRTLQVGQ